MAAVVVSGNRARGIRILALTTASLLVATAAQAQEAATPADDSAAAAQAAPLPAAPAAAPAEDAQANPGEIIVTARRRAEALSEVPGAVTAFTTADLEARGVTQPGDFLDVTPGVFFRTNTTVGTSFVNIRGVTQSRNAESPVAIVVDGVFLNNPLGFQNQLVDIAQIEVLKGPQGALYGRNASAGAIIITTPEPTNDFRGYVGGGFGRHQTYKAEVALSGPIVEDKLLFRVVGYAHGTDGFLKNFFLSTPGNPYYMDAQRDIGGRLRLLWNVSDSVTADLRYGHTETRGGFNNNVSDVTGAFPLSDYANPRIITGIPYTANVRGFDNRITDDASLKLDWTSDAGVLTAVTGFNNLRDAGGGDSLPYKSTPADGTQFLVNNYKTWSQEVRFTSPGDRRFRYLFGGYYQHTDRLFSSSSGTDLGQGIVIIDPSGRRNGPTSLNPASGGISATRIDQNAFAVFGSVGFDITERFELSAALRYDQDDEEATNDGPFGAGFSVNPLRGTTRDLTFKKLQPKVTLRYKTGTGNIYLTYAEGFKNGGFNPQGARAAALATNPNTPIRDDFGSETTTTIEGGIKGTLANNALTYGLAGYYNRIKGANYFDFIVAAATQIILNIDQVDVYGVEAEFTARPTRTFTIAGSASYSDNKIKKFAFDPRSVGRTSPFFPDFQANLSAQWQDHVAANLQASARIDLQHVGRIYWDLNEVARRPPINFVDARVGLIYDDESPLRVDLYCRNCTNRNYINEALILSQIGLAVAFPVRDAREFGIEFSKRF